MKNIKEKLLVGFLYLCIGWAVLALSVDFYVLYLHETGQVEKVKEITGQIPSSQKKDI